MTKHFRLTSGQFSHFTPPENVFRGYIALGTWINGLITISLLIPLILKRKELKWQNVFQKFLKDLKTFKP